MERMKRRTTVAVLCDLRGEAGSVRSFLGLGEEKVEENLANYRRVVSRNCSDEFGGGRILVYDVESEDELSKDDTEIVHVTRSVVVERSRNSFGTSPVTRSLVSQRGES